MAGGYKFFAFGKSQAPQAPGRVDIQNFHRLERPPVTCFDGDRCERDLKECCQKPAKLLIREAIAVCSLNPNYEDWVLPAHKLSACGVCEDFCFEYQFGHLCLKLVAGSSTGVSTQATKTVPNIVGRNNPCSPLRRVIFIPARMPFSSAPQGLERLLGQLARRRPSNTIGRDDSPSGPTFAAQPPLFVNALLLKRLAESHSACPGDGASRLKFGSAGPADPTFLERRPSPTWQTAEIVGRLRRGVPTLNFEVRRRAACIGLPPGTDCPVEGNAKAGAPC